MVITTLRAGLGNQLFQYAVGRRLAAWRGVPLKLDLEPIRVPQETPGLETFARSYRLHEFNIVAEIATPAELGPFFPAPASPVRSPPARGGWGGGYCAATRRRCAGECTSTKAI